jgi:hypothetical protein
LLFHTNRLEIVSRRQISRAGISLTRLSPLLYKYL